LFLFAYGDTSKVFVRGMQQGKYIPSSSGVKQGDPIAMFYFCLTTYAALQTADSCSEAHVIAYADDIYITGPPWESMKAFFKLQDLLQPLGLHLNPHKCELYCRQPMVGAILAEHCDIQNSSEGITVLGTPLGTPEYVHSTLHLKVEQAIELVNTLLSLPLHSQTKWVLLHRSLQRKFAHLKYTVPWFLLHVPLHRFERRIERAALTILDLEEPLTKGLNQVAVSLHLWLPLRLGGYDIDNTSKAIADASWLSKAAQCDIAFTAGPPSFRPFTGDGPEMDALWRDLVAVALNLCPRDIPQAQKIDEIALPMLQAAPRIVQTLTNSQRHEELLAVLPSPQDRA
jgi:hypothetical protein